MTVNYLYRVVETTYSAGCDEYGDPLPGGPTRLNLLMTPVRKETPEGYWVPEDRRWAAGTGLWRWVSKRRAIPYASLTPEEALAAWKKGANYRILLMKRRIEMLIEAERSFTFAGFYSDARTYTDPDKPDLLVRMENGAMTA